MRPLSALSYMLPTLHIASIPGFVTSYNSLANGNHTPPLHLFCALVKCPVFISFSFISIQAKICHTNEGKNLNARHFDGQLWVEGLPTLLSVFHPFDSNANSIRLLYYYRLESSWLPKKFHNFWFLCCEQTLKLWTRGIGHIPPAPWRCIGRQPQEATHCAKIWGHAVSQMYFWVFIGLLSFVFFGKKKIYIWKFLSNNLLKSCYDVITIDNFFHKNIYLLTCIYYKKFDRVKISKRITCFEVLFISYYYYKIF